MQLEHYIILITCVIIKFFMQNCHQDKWAAASEQKAADL